MNNVVGSSAGAAYIECVNPKKDKWKIRWDMQERDDGTCSWVEEDFNHKPSTGEIKETITGWYNGKTEEEILTGFEWNGHLVWLSMENQLNYKVAYDLAVQTDGQNLPVTFKFGTDEEPYYQTFDTLEELRDFYVQMIGHIQDALSEGWNGKDAIDWGLYTA